jgi:FtsP/CotA-like multicopper oxidase with cupredoxin domain
LPWGDQAAVDPAPGEAFRDPTPLALTRPAPGIVEGALSVAFTDTSLAGTSARLLTYNGLLPGPLIRVKRGDTLRLKLSNDLPPSSAVNLLGHRSDLTNIHTHGWHVSPEDPADNVLRPVSAGDSWTYSYDLSLQPQGTMGWYHPHVHGLVAEQLWQGLAGPLIVEDESPLLASFETHVMVLKDFALADGAATAYESHMDYMEGKQGPILTVNGLVNPVLTARPGQVQRWRIVNASTSRFYPLSLEGHELSIIGCDGGLLDRPYPRSTMLLAPGERLDVLVQASREAGRHRLLALPYSSGSMMGGSMMGGQTSPMSTLLTLDIDSRAVSDAIPSLISDTARPQVDLSRLPQRRFALEMGMGRAFINGQDYDTSPFTVRSSVPPSGESYEVWTIVNRSGMDHPWHQHVNFALPLTFDGGDAAYADLYARAPAWKDTVVVPRSGSVTQLVRVSDWTGPTVYHCHIVEHEDIGMMGVWRLEEVA